MFYPVRLIPETDMADETVHLVLNANSLMNFQRPDQVDWPAMLKCRSVNLIITPVLLRVRPNSLSQISRGYKKRGTDILVEFGAFAFHPRILPM
jgi:hypothetical protein